MTIYEANTWYQSKGGQCSVMGLLKQFMIWRLKSLDITPVSGFERGFVEL
jgi:hypothetical protein